MREKHFFSRFDKICPMSELAIHVHVDNPSVYVCRILLKAQKAGMRAAVLFDDASAMRSFDDFAWSVDSESFIPHAVAGTAGAVRGAALLSQSTSDLTGADLLVLCCRKARADIGTILKNFPKVIDIVGLSEESLAEGRARFVAYKKAGITPTVHDRAASR